jgi:hypothetical protein
MPDKSVLKGITVAICISLLFACQPKVPKEALTLSPQSLENRQMQTRWFDTDDENRVLSACSGVLQDLGFNLDESETDLGLIVGSKTRSAVNAGEVVGAIVVAALTGAVIPTSKDQKMRACLVTFPSGEEGKSTGVRVTFQRIVWNTQGQVTCRECLDNPEIYQEFFAKLSKSLFLEANEI